MLSKTSHKYRVIKVLLLGGYQPTRPIMQEKLRSSMMAQPLQKDSSFIDSYQTAIEVVAIANNLFYRCTSHAQLINGRQFVNRVAV